MTNQVVLDLEQPDGRKGLRHMNTKPLDLSGLIKGLMVVIGIAMALGKLDDLKRWAMKEAFHPSRRGHISMKSAITPIPAYRKSSRHD